MQRPQRACWRQSVMGADGQRVGRGGGAVTAAIVGAKSAELRNERRPALVVGGLKGQRAEGREGSARGRQAMAERAAAVGCTGVRIRLVRLVGRVNPALGLLSCHAVNAGLSCGCRGLQSLDLPFHRVKRSRTMTVRAASDAALSVPRTGAIVAGLLCGQLTDARRNARTGRRSRVEWPSGRRC